jgi:hypothetical protein
MTVLTVADDFQGTNGNPIYSTGSEFDSMSTGSVDTNFAFSTDFALPGLTTSARSTSTGYQWGNYELTSHTRHRDRFSMYVPAIPPARTMFYEVMVGDGSTIAMQLTIDTSGNLSARNVTTAVGTTPCPLGEWFDVEVDLEANQRFWVYQGATQYSTNQANATGTIDAALTATNFSVSKLGRVNSLGSSYTYYFGYHSEITTSETPTPYSPPSGATNAAAVTATATSLVYEPTKKLNPVVNQAAATAAGFQVTPTAGSDSIVGTVQGAVAVGQASDAMTTAMKQYQLFRNASGLIVPA